MSFRVRIQSVRHPSVMTCLVERAPTPTLISHTMPSFYRAAFPPRPLCLCSVQLQPMINPAWVLSLIPCVVVVVVMASSSSAFAAPAPATSQPKVRVVSNSASYFVWKPCAFLPVDRLVIYYMPCLPKKKHPRQPSCFHSCRSFHHLPVSIPAAPFDGYRRSLARQ